MQSSNPAASEPPARRVSYISCTNTYFFRCQKELVFAVSSMKLPGLFSAISVVVIFQLNLMGYKIEISVNF